jgi:hypothetical protein
MNDTTPLIIRIDSVGVETQPVEIPAELPTVHYDQQH